MFDLTGKSIVVTGAASGIGAGTAQRLRRAGANVLIGDLADGAAQAAEWGCAFQRTDVSDPAQMTGLLDKAVELHGGLDVLVNNAAAAGVHNMAEADEARAERYFRINAMSVLVGMREAVKRMKPGGAIVNIASLSGARGTPGWGEYGMSKAAIISATQTAALEFGPLGIRVNAISPGGIATPLSISINGDALTRALEVLTPAGREGQPDDIAAAVHFLASSDASYITGQNLFVDGGWSIGTTVQTIGKILS
ncbi:SDR family NAD(P)-dependent oxidoreductase [Novosphingobium colocasiae]|nr:SDR family oxidoreductase [Novosphingobium colocasiae]